MCAALLMTYEVHIFTFCIHTAKQNFVNCFYFNQAASLRSSKRQVSFHRRKPSGNIPTGFKTMSVEKLWCCSRAIKV